MMKSLQEKASLKAIVAIILIVFFISTSIEMTNTADGQTWVYTIGLGLPWYQHIQTPSGFTWKLNFLMPTFISGIVGFYILWSEARRSIIDSRQKHRA